MAGMPARGGETRTARKRRAILDAATILFLRDGYLATSMDQIAAAASVSKQTVYKQFADKQSLFREIVTGTVAEVSDPVAEQVASLRDSHAFGPMVAADIRYDLHVAMIRHGRTVCRAQRPSCSACVLNDLCAYGRQSAASAGQRQPSVRGGS